MTCSKNSRGDFFDWETTPAATALEGTMLEISRNAFLVGEKTPAATALEGTILEMISCILDK